MTRTAQLLATALAAAALLAGCGGDDDNDSGAAADTVATQSVDGAGDVLVDARGRALYTADQESDGKVRCTAGCAAIWLPLTVPGGSEPSAASDVPGELALVKRPDGKRQVTLDGVPLYRFAEDGGPGKVTGDGLSDRFGGREFSWQVAGGGMRDEEEEPAPSDPYGY